METLTSVGTRCATPYSFIMCSYYFGIQVMDDWLTRVGSHDYPATWEGLYSLLNDLGYGNVAVKLEKAVSGQVSHSN